jgi:predicted phosphate transport protein (TIGR00153 family)
MVPVLVDRNPHRKASGTVRRMAKIRLIPQTREFYTLFDRSAQNLVSTSQLLLDLLEHYPDRRDLVEQIKDREHDGDSVTHEIVQLVNKTFVTPIDGEDIYDLATALDDVCDFMDQVADELNLFGVDEVPREAIEQAAVIVKAVAKLADAIARLEGLKDISALLVEIHTLEDEGDRIVRAATARLFRDGHDPLVVIRWKDIYEHLEQAVDSCERSAHVLESIYLKNR